MKQVRTFLLKGKESMINHIKSVDELGCCYWKKAKNKRFQIGDVCYLFLSDSGHNQIRYRLEVIDTSCQRADKNCWHVPYTEDNDCYKLIPTALRYDGSELSYSALGNIGIKKHTQFMELNEVQVAYIDKYFNE